MTPQDDAPYGIFKLAYSIITWSSTVLMALVMIWVIRTMFINTSAGTTQSLALETVRPTQTALAQYYTGKPMAPAIPPICLSCHIIAGKGNQVCPNLTEIGLMADQHIADPGYTGNAKTAEEYIRESILEPSKFCVPNEPGKVYCANGVSIMPTNLAAQVPNLDELVAWLATQGKPVEAEGAEEDMDHGAAADGTPGAEGTPAVEGTPGAETVPGAEGTPEVEGTPTAAGTGF